MSTENEKTFEDLLNFIAHPDLETDDPYELIRVLVNTLRTYDSLSKSYWSAQGKEEIYEEIKGQSRKELV